MKTIHKSLYSMVFGLFLLGASSTIQSCSKFDKVGLENATNLSTSLSELMSKSASSKYSANADAIKKVTESLSNAVKHAESVKKNMEIASAWTSLQNELVLPFLSRWKEKGMLDADYVKAATEQVSKSLEAIKKAEQSRK